MSTEWQKCAKIGLKLISLENQGSQIFKCGLSLYYKKVQSKLACHIKWFGVAIVGITVIFHANQGGHILLGRS